MTVLRGLILTGLSGLLLTGCSKLPSWIGGSRASTTTTTETAPASTEPSIVPSALTAEQLADILQVNTWSWTYHGPTPEVWLEIEEHGQDTMPDRIPTGERGHLGGSSSRREGSILLWWRRTDPDGGGILTLDVDGAGSYSYGLNKDAFVLGWKNWSGQWSVPKIGEPIEVTPGQEQTLLTYTAQSMPEDGATSEENGEGKKIVLRLKAWFPEGPEPPL